jgi:ADP-heptose:LPS heptosyltransferase
MPFRLADFYNETRGARKLIVVDLGYLGDSIQLIPTLCEIKRNYPAAALHVVSAPVGSELLDLAPSVDRTWPRPLAVGRSGWSAQWRWIRAIRREQFDVAFNFSGVDRTTILAFLTGARWRVAYAGGRHHFWNRWLIPYWVARQDRTLPLAEQRRQMLAACGLEVGSVLYPIHIPPAAQDWAKVIIPSFSIHLSINAGHPLKEWPLDHWITLVQSLLRETPKLQLVATAGPSHREQDRLTEFNQAIGDARLRILSNLSVAQLAALLARCQLHIGADSGALHLAAVLGLRTVSLFREYTGIGEWLPRGPLHRQLIAPCSCVNRRIQPCAATGHPECLAALSVDKVLGLAHELLQEQ